MSRFLTLLWTVVTVALGGCIICVEANNTAAIIQFINSITLTGQTITITGTSSEDKALLWLVTENDPQYHFTPGSIVNNTRLAQRYALATYFIDNAKPRDEWLSDQSECLWRYVRCLSDSNVTNLGMPGYIGGRMPLDLGLLSSLREVYWQLNGTLSSSIGKWTDLNSVRFLCTPPCNTTLPTTIGNWRNVREVVFRHVGFTGSLPATIGNWTNLQQIQLYNTSLNAMLPTSIGSWMDVESVSILHNRFSGPLPSTIGRWSSLRFFDLYDNGFSEILPVSIENWRLVERMDLSFNWFSGSLPIGDWMNLTYLDVGNNNFTGTISPKVSNWTSINYVDLHGNNFNGTIPRSICSHPIVIAADCTDEVVCWCCDGCAPPNQISGILFRELRPDAQDGSWGPSTIEIPGFDHVALSYLDSVYESHPGYKNGPVYVSADRFENRTIPILDGVQNVHTLETFKHNSPNATTSPVINFQVVPIDNATALIMKNIISPKVGAAGFLAFNSIDEFVAKLAPSAQKGGNGRFTGCGLIEWAAEQAGINNGQGFVPNDVESIVTPNGTYPLLTPEFLYAAIQNQGLFNSTTQNYFKAYFDPVDYMVTDPIGRRAIRVNGTRTNQIPDAVQTLKGDIESLVISRPLPGEYEVKMYGIRGQKGLSVVQVGDRLASTARTNGDASITEQTIEAPVVAGSRGDVNGDGVINQTDLILLKSRIPQMVTGFNSADMNGDKQLNQTDVELLTAYLNLPTKAPTRAPIRTKPPPAPLPRGTCPAADKCNNGGYTLHRTTTRRSRCRQRCTSKWLTQWLLLNRKTIWKCGKC